MTEGSPVGEIRSNLWFLLGSALGGTVAAALVLAPIALLGGALAHVLRFWGGVVVLFLVAAAIQGLVRLPRIQRQAKQQLGELSPALGAFVFGFELGAGLRTYTSSVALYLAAVPAVLGFPIAHLLALGLSFGVLRGLVPMDRYVSRRGGTWDNALRAKPAVVSLAPYAGLLVAAAAVLI